MSLSSVKPDRLLATTKTAAAATIFTRSIIILLDRMVISSNVKHF
jgi:hypothetical protein